MILRELLRDIKRYKWRSLAVIVSIAVGIGVLSIVSNMSASMEATGRAIDLKYATPDIVFRFDGYYEVNDVISAINEVDDVAVVEPRLTLFGSMYRNNETVYVNVVGSITDPVINSVKVQDESIWERFKGNVCIVDKVMAEKVGFNEGDKMVFYSKYGKLGFEIIDLADMGWSRSFNMPINLGILVPIETVQSIIGQDGKANVLYIKVSSFNKIEKVYSKVESILKELKLKFSGWYKTASYNPLSGSALIIFGIMFLPATLIAGTLLASVLLNKVAGEYRLIGMRKAIGFTPLQIFTIILIEGLLYFIMSIPLAYVLSYLLTLIGIKILLGAFGVEVIVKVDAVGFINSMFVGLLMTLLFTSYPANKARKVKTLEAIRWGFEVIKHKSRSRTSRLPKLLAMAWRNLTRRKKRTGLMIASLIISTSAALSMTVLMDSVHSTFVEGFAESMKGDFSIFFDELLNDSDISRVASLDEVQLVEGSFNLFIPIQNFSMLINNGSVDVGKLYAWPYVQFVPPDSEFYKPKIVKGSWIQKENDFIISHKVATYIGVRVGDTITLMYQRVNDTVKITGRVVGIAQLLWQNGWHFITHIANANTSGLAPKNTYNMITIQLNQGYKLDDTIDKVYTLLSNKKPSSIFVNKDAVNVMNDFVNSIQLFLTVIIISTILVVVIGLASGFIMITNERKWEIGLLKSIGGTNSDAIKIFLYEALIIVLIATPIGILGGVYLGNTLISMVNKSFIIGVYPTYKTQTIAIYTIIPLAIALTAIIPTTVIATKTKPVKLLRKTI